MTLFKHFAFVGVSYLVLRELPIKNFYARSVIWGIIGLKVFANYGFDPWNKGITTNYILDAPERYTNQF